MKVVLATPPEALEIDLERTAVVLVDMQNAFASKGGMLDLAGIDVTESAKAVENARILLEAARASGIPIIYLVMGYPRTSRRQAATTRRIRVKNSR